MELRKKQKPLWEKGFRKRLEGKKKFMGFQTLKGKPQTKTTKMLAKMQIPRPCPGTTKQAGGQLEGHGRRSVGSQRLA